MATYKTVLSCAVKDERLSGEWPKKVTIRYYGQKTGARAVACRDEICIAINMIHSFRLGLSPKLYGVFDGGRIEEFVEV